MVRNILVVDDNQPFLNLIKKIFDKYENKYQLQTCLDGLLAIEMLKKNTFSLVVSDLQMPNMDGFALLSKINEQFPDIPVIIITAFDKPKTGSVITKKGAAAYFTKPLVMEDLIAKIDEIVSKETEGGQLHNASLEMFIQLIEMEAKTCTIRVYDEVNKKTGVLFFNGGELFEARYGAITGKEAAYQVFSWDKVTLSIENHCVIQERKIQDELQAILLDAMRMKDEIGSSEEDFSEEPENNVVQENESEALIKSEEKSNTPEDNIKKKLSGILDVDADIISIEVDNSLKDFIEQSNAFGDYFDIGHLTAGYFDKKETENTIIITNEDGTCVELVVGKKCSPDRIIKNLI